MIFNFSDEDLVNNINSILSCLLPHSNFNRAFYQDCWEGLNHLIKPDELPVPYNIILGNIRELNSITLVVKDYIPKLTRDSLDNLITSSIQEYVQNNSRYVVSWMDSEGVECDLQNPENVERCYMYVYQKTMETYDTCFELEKSSEDFPNIYLALKNSVKSNSVSYSVNVQARIISESYRVGRKIYRGYDGAIEYIKKFTLELDERMNDISEETIILDSLEKVEKINSMNESQNEAIGEYGIPVLDDYTPILRHRLVTIAADPNVGKTINACEIAASLLYNERIVVFMTGESPTNTIKNMILSAYIRKKYNMFVTPAQISGRVVCDDEVTRIINIADLEIAEAGNLILRESFTYDGVYEELSDLYKTINFDAVIIDHSASLNRRPGSKLFSNKERIDEEGVQLREFKKKYPVAVIVTSHLSVEAASELIRLGTVKTNSTCRDSSVFNKESDELFVLYTNELLSEQHMRGLIIKKRRNAEVPRNHVLLKFYPQYTWFDYKDEYQADSSEDIKKDNALNTIKGIMQDEEEDDIFEEADIW